MVKELKPRKWYQYYTVGFLVGAFTLLLLCLATNATLIWGGDGYIMSYTTIQYASKFWTSLLQGDWIMMDFTIGEGLDPIQCMTYYGLTEPWNILYAICPSSWAAVIFSLLSILRIFASGLAFGFYAKKYSQHHAAIAIGALVYAFAWYNLFWLQAPTLLNASILFPLMLYYLEKGLEQQKCTGLIVVTAIAYFTNYYIAAVMSMMLLVYAILYLCVEHQWRQVGVWLRVAFSHAVGILVAGIVLMPCIWSIINSARASHTSGYSNLFWFPWQYYLDTIKHFFTPNTNATHYWNAPYQAQLNYLPIALPALLLALSTKTKQGDKLRRCKWALLICGIFLVVPLFPSLFNGNSYTTHRWTFALSVLMSMLVVWAVPKLLEMPKWIKWTMFGYFAVSAVLSWFLSNPDAAILSSLLMFCIIFGITSARTLKTMYTTTLLSIFVYCVISFGMNSYLGAFNKLDIYEYASKDMYAVIDWTDEDLEEFVRAASTNDTLSVNIGTLFGFKTNTSTWNVISQYAGEYANQAQAYPDSPHSFWIVGSDDRTAAQALSGVKYFITTEQHKIAVPYGFTLVETTTGLDHNSIEKQEQTLYVYENTLNPGIGYLYQNTLSKDAFYELNIAERQSAFMNYAIVDSGATNFQSETEALSFTAESTDTNTRITVNIPVGYEVYLAMDDVYYNADAMSGIPFSPSGVPLVTTSNDDAFHILVTDAMGRTLKKNVKPTSPNTHMMHPSNLRTVCLGSQLSGEVTIDINHPDTCSIGNINLYAYSTSAFANSASALQQNAWANVKYSTAGEDKTDFIEGDITAQFDGVFQLAVPYSPGWTAYVDGEKVEVFDSGIKYMGIQLTQGEHHIRFVYKTPWWNVGMAMTILGCVITITTVIVEKRRKVKSPYAQV